MFLEILAGWIIIFLVGWIFISIPASLTIAAVIHNRNKQKPIDRPEKTLHQPAKPLTENETRQLNQLEQQLHEDEQAT